MPIQPIVLQRRLVEVGRIRLGRKVPTQNGKSRPGKLDKFRLTSRDKARLDAAAELYGGTVAEWEGQWELITDAEVIPIVVVPGQALSQNFELWGQKTRNGQKSPVICLRRCDGVTEAISGEPCLCNGEPEQQCKPTTRLSVILTEVPGLGVWRLESHGWNAATELAGTVQMLEALVATGRPIRARLRLDKREVKRESGTNKFVVPVVDIDHTMGQVLDAIGIEQGPALDVEGHELARPAFTPVAALEQGNGGGAAPSIAEQVAAAGELERAPRANAAQEIPRSGVRPRTVAEVAGADTVPVPAGAAGEGSSVAAGDEPSPSPTDDGGAMPLQQRVAMWIGELARPEGMKADDFRHAFLEAFSDGNYSSARDVSPDDVHALRATMVRYQRGHVTLDASDGARAMAGHAVFREAVTGLPSTDPGGQSPGRRGGPVDPDAMPVATEPMLAEQPALDVYDEGFWRSEIAKVQGIGPARLVKAARDLAAEAGVAQPTGLDEITDQDLAGMVLAWLRSQAAA